MQDLKHKTDEELVQKAQTGDGIAMDEILSRYNPIVRARARHFFLAGGETEDLVQEGMFGLYLAVRDYKPDSGKRFKNFAYLCFTRRIYDTIRRTTAKKTAAVMECGSPFDQYVLDILDEGLSPEEYVIDSETRSELQVKLMRELSDLEYRVLNLYMDGMSYAQICEATNKPVKSVDNALARAKSKLQKVFKK